MKVRKCKSPDRYNIHIIKRKLRAMKFYFINLHIEKKTNAKSNTNDKEQILIGYGI